LWQDLAKAAITLIQQRPPVEKCVAAHRACPAEPTPAAADGPEPEAAVLARAGPPDPTGKFADTARRRHERVEKNFDKYLWCWPDTLVLSVPGDSVVSDQATPAGR
jgi:hypothetical protein